MWLRVGQQFWFNVLVLLKQNIISRILIFNTWLMISRLSHEFQVCLICEKNSSEETELVILSCHIHWAHWWWWCPALPQKVCFSPILPGVDCNELSVVAADLWFLQSCSRLSGMRAPLMALFFPCVDLEKLRKLPRGLHPQKENSRPVAGMNV